MNSSSGHRNLPPPFPFWEDDTSPPGSPLSPPLVMRRSISIGTTATSGTFTSSTSSTQQWLSVLETGEDRPPDYTPFDALANAFALKAPLIYATGTSHTPRYQLLLVRTRSGKPYKLKIRRLLASESRRLSQSKVVEYEDDCTMYTIGQQPTLSGFIGDNKLEIRGERSWTLPGFVRVEKGMNGWKCWHFTKNRAADSLLEENEKRIQKYGYHPSKEWNKVLLFSVTGKGGFLGRGKTKKAEWRNRNGDIVAFEDEGLTIVQILSEKWRDILITCWTARYWSTGALAGWETGNGGRKNSFS